MFKVFYTYDTPKGRYQIKDTGRPLEITTPCDHTSKHYEGGAWIYHETETGDLAGQFCDLIERCDNVAEAKRVLSDILHAFRITGSLGDYLKEVHDSSSDSSRIESSSQNHPTDLNTCLERLNSLQAEIEKSTNEFAVEAEKIESEAHARVEKARRHLDHLHALFNLNLRAIKDWRKLIKFDTASGKYIPAVSEGKETFCFRISRSGVADVRLNANSEEEAREIIKGLLSSNAISFTMREDEIRQTTEAVEC